MATIRDTLALIVNADAKGAVKELERVGNTADKQMGRARSATDKWAGRLQSSGAVAVGAATVGAAALFKLGDAAGDLSETQNKVNVVFGESAGKIHDFGKTSATAVGLSKNAAEGAAATYGNLFRAIGLTEDKSAEMSVEMVKLAGDLASFNNADPTEVLDALRAGLVGETEPLRKFGISINDARLRQEALNLGLKVSTGPLSAATKAQASYALILKDSSIAQGDFARTSGGAANQQRILKARLEDLKAGIGAGVLPVLTNLLGVANQVTGAFTGMSAENQKAVGTFATYVTGAIGALGATSFLAGSVLKLKDRFTDSSGSINNFGKAAGVLGVGLPIIGAALAINAREAEKNDAVFTELAETFLKGGEQADEMTAALDRQRPGLGSLIADYRDLRIANDDSANAVRGQAEELAKGEGLFSATGIVAGQLTEKIEQQTEAYSSSEKQTVALKVAQKAYADALASGNATEEDLIRLKGNVVSASTQQAETQTAVTTATREGTEATDTNAKALDKKREALEKAEKKLRDYTDAVFGSRDAERAAQDAGLSLTEALITQKEATDAARLAGGKNLELNFALKRANNDVESAIDAVSLTTGKYAEEQGKLGGKALKTGQSIAFQKNALEQLRDQISPKSPFRAYLEGLIRDLDRAAVRRDGSLDVKVRVNGKEISIDDPRVLNLNPFNRGGVGARAGGGPVREGRPYVVGEEGPELFIPGASGTIVPNGKRSAGVAGAGPGFTINVAINNPTGNGREIAIQLVDALNQGTARADIRRALQLI